ncbi:MAG: ribonuclease H-like domain-containing protein [Desulfobacterales bacterium]|uniref:Ribonuclease H-like domain-containing protein n=1 Tax=Candidatus Desulfatibia vada TaxID=2841696 RepID=A0A8J6NXM6_9BACT|nr:ribonuclease H-like domain-containing protein [Candidatus Desulfatibia vada]MBL6972012.1 ribonuclease H-like domain-containing protein [Desulfobacterales bacterium]
MLKNTFIHIPGIGPKTEQRFWDSGIHNWDDFTQYCPIRLSQSKTDTIASYLEESKQNLKFSNPNYFSDLLPSSQHWRFFSEFRKSTVYLDIETTGLESWGNEITTIALYDSDFITYYINGQNLNEFPDDIRKYKVIVTYNGKTFDIPFIEKYFNIRLDHSHIDLRYILGSLGYRGGLKSCETQLGIDRGDLAGVDGFCAVLLWHDYKRTGNQKALETLLAYNIQDVLTLENLMVIAYNMKIKDTPFYEKHLSAPVLPDIPFEVDMKTVDRIRSGVEFQYYY